MEQPLTGAQPARYLWRPRITLALLLSYFALFGIIIGAQGVLWPDILIALRMSEGTFGTAQLVSPLVAVVLLLQSGPLCHRVGKKRLALLAMPVLLSGIVVLALARDVWGFVLAIALAGAGFGLVEMVMNSATLDWEQATGRDVMNMMHAGFSGGAMVGAFSAGLMRGAGWEYQQVLYALGGLCVLVLVATLPTRYPPEEHAEQSSAGPGASIRLLLSQSLLIMLAAICLISTIGESIANTWSVIHLYDLGAPAFVGGAAFALFNLTMFIGRMVNTSLVARFGARASLLASGAGIALSGVLLLVPQLWVAVVAFALLGLAVAGVVPTVLSAAARLVPGQSGAITGGIMSVAYLSFIISPPLIGWFAEIFSLQSSFVIVAVSGMALFWMSRGIRVDGVAK